MVKSSKAVLAAGLAAVTGSVQAVAIYGQCGGLNTIPAPCDAGLVCTVINDFYWQCLAGSAVTTSSKPISTASGTKTSSVSGSTTKTSTSATASSTVAPVSDSPFVGYTPYINSYYAAEVSAAVKNISDASVAAKAATVAKIPTFYWLDVAAKIPQLGTFLADAQSIQKSTGVKQLVEIVVYDLPDRDCAALASNGEYSIANNGAANYKAYIDGIAAQIAKYPDVRVVAVVEPDSLANLVTNLNVAKCSNAATTYKTLTAYAIQKLNQANIFLYLDAGHAGWLGWPANITPAAQLFGDLLKSAGSPNRVRGLATNVANYNAFVAASPDPITQGNSNYDESHYINALAPLLSSQGFPAHFIVDTGRSGHQNIRTQWGDWCNVVNAGFGIRPTTSTGNSYVDAFVWVKPGGEGDGTSNTSAVRYDAHCGLDDAKKPAPEAGSWFQAYFVDLVTNANPSL